MRNYKWLFSSCVAIGVVPTLLTAAIIPIDIENDLTNGAGGPAMPLILTVTDGQVDVPAPPTSSWLFNPQVIDPSDGIGTMDNFFVSVASGVEGETGFMAMAGSSFSDLASGTALPILGSGFLDYADNVTGAPQDGLVSDTILWTSISGTTESNNDTPFNDLGLALWWSDIDNDVLVSPGDQLHIMAMLYSTDGDLVAFTQADTLSDIAGITPIPEPGSVLLLGTCLAGFAFLRRRRG